MKHNWIEYFDVDSDYWKKVEKIYNENDHFPKKVVKHRNLHHKFPKSFSRKEGFDIDNDEDNLISLSLADHFLVHYYLWKCSKKGYRNSMALAFRYMCNTAIKYASDETIEQLAKDYDALMKDVLEAHKSEETRKKLSEAHKGKKLSDVTRKKLSEAHKGKKGKNRSEETKKKMSDAQKGKKLSDVTKTKISNVMKVARWYNNGEINVRVKECPEGFIPGRLKNKNN